MAWFRKKMWLDVEDGWRGWIDTPNSGADASATAWSTSGTLLNGGGYATHSWGSHKRYTFEWPESSARQTAQFMKSLRDGTYGRGLIHFIEPTLYDTNILPAVWADPSMTLDMEDNPFVYGIDPTPTETPNAQERGLPFRTTVFDLEHLAPGYRGDEESLYIPIPDGYTLALGAFYATTGSFAGIFARGIRTDGTWAEDVQLTKLSGDSDSTVVDLFSGFRAVRLWVGKALTARAGIAITAMCARLIPSDKIYHIPVSSGYGDLPYNVGPYGGGLEGTYGTPEYGGGYYGGAPETAAFRKIRTDPWCGGMGNSGVRFDGVPTLVHYTGVGGGQVGYAASFVEVGDWT